MIFIEFCILKSPKPLTFSGSGSERLERGPQYLARRRNFQKGQRTLVVLRWRYNPREKVQLIPIPTVPHPKNKKVLFSPVLAAFSTKLVEHRGFQDELHFRRPIFQPRRRTENYLGSFEFFAYGLRNRGVSVGLLGQN